eukprot:TRINITY_DN12732_c0_g1::TRINITY_DN12732_c0_g1_i1::g.28699::m.28699 TRINITY_DN12732_c0_g1::TRINITY_DN12732_c0_g1_i1::g.28699  ORF type:complete len:178 (-),score=20.13,sp/P42322/CANB1_NAEGR/67.80/7e-83,EF-hand_1/PF00036.27/3.1e-05,EF-hand_1/PF00036.27/7.6e-07,EF-hand_1/PF00036.27/4.7e-06,EF-hand_1/PF00036.27/4.5e-05,EF-hand_7/PF13499.1/1.3e-10,EF-hand_7/PF13499.1/1.3e-12,EF-hand_6/PF13405.1/0.0007,EF-hand_6/PF13405.1/0.00024,EF-hand_6/PF13405.1/8.2e-05,EF-hand_6/PF13405.1/1.8,EF-hand_5/PF13202.1/0
MGQAGSNLSADEVNKLQDGSHFTESEIKRIYKRFQKLDKNGNGLVSKDEFLEIPELASNPLVNRVISIFDRDGDGNVDFEEFISALNVFSSKGAKDDKLRFAFKVYDIDGNGFISNGELFTVLKMMVGNNLTDVQLQQIVDKTMIEADKDLDGQLSYEEFVTMISTTDLESKLTIRF